MFITPTSFNIVLACNNPNKYSLSSFNEDNKFNVANFSLKF